MSKWMKCSERLPKSGTKVLATDGKIVSIGNTFGLDIHRKNATPMWDCYDVINTMKITH